VARFIARQMVMVGTWFDLCRLESGQFANRFTPRLPRFPEPASVRAPPVPHMPNGSPVPEFETALRLVVEGTAAETGTEFFRTLVKNLVTALGMEGAWVSEYLPKEQKLRALGMWFQGRFIEGFEYPIAGTFCQQVIEGKKLTHVSERLIELFPAARHLMPPNAVSCLGAPMVSPDGTVVGHLAVLDTKVMPADPRAIALFEIFLARAAAEIRRLKAEQEIRNCERQLSTLLETAMDAILVLDSDLRATRINQAAARVFGCTAEDMIGESVGEYLDASSAGRVAAFARELESRPDGRQQVWVTQDFVARRWDHTVFPAEATLSRFESRGATFFTLILRNVDERIEAEKQVQLLLQETEYLREEVRAIPGQGELLGRSEGIAAVFSAIKQVAKTDAAVLITGETGTGKEMIARSIHRASARAEKPLVTVNCAAIPENLVESELFGHERGAFTGAVTRREGRFSLAQGGTIFLDEIGEMPLEVQPKLLRVLQEGEFEPLGGTKTVRVDVRVVSATHRDLRQMVRDGKFREDLYFRLHVFPIHLPALRERGGDIGLLAAAFTERFARRAGKRIQPLTEPQLRLLRDYDWPGNVRELQNVIERAIILTTGSELQLHRAMVGFTPAAPRPQAAAQPLVKETRVLTMHEVEHFERANILKALEACSWRVSGDSGAARLLGLPATTLSSRMKALKVERQGA
jgi:PAS domain S-box-containing protein